MAKKISRNGANRQARAKEKARNNRIKRDAAKRNKAYSRTVNRQMYMEAIARKNPQLFKFLATSGFEQQGKPVSNKELAKESASVIRACIYAANRIQLMSLVGLDKFNITRDQHLKFENDLHIVFNHMEKLTDTTRKVSADDFDMVAEVTTCMMDIQEFLAEINSEEYLTKYAEHFAEMKKNAELLFAKWIERGHAKEDIGGLMFARYMDQIADRIEEEQKQEHSEEPEKLTPVCSLEVPQTEAPEEVDQ